MEKETIHTLTIGNQTIKYTGLIISVQGVNIDSGLDSNVLIQVDQSNNKYYYGLLFILLMIYILSLFFINLSIFKILSLIIPVAFGIILTKLWDMFKIWIGVIILLMISLYFQSEINITQIMDLLNKYFSQKH